MSLQDHYNKSIGIYERINVGTNFKPIYSWSLVTTVAGMMDELSTSERIQRDGTVSEYEYMILLDVLSLNNDDRFVIDSNAYNIAPPQNPNGLDHHLEVRAKRLGVNEYNETISGESSS